MPKLKAPLLSLGATGTIADRLTFRKRDGITIAERTPVLKDARTLKQVYQRWLYQDYVAWWHDQTPAIKLLYEKNARPFHMTGFAYWMREKLSTLPDIAGAWHLDEGSGLTIKDFSRNSNNGTITGPTWVKGHFGNALRFDGNNDIVNCGTSPSLDLAQLFTIEAWLTINTLKAYSTVATKQNTLRTDDTPPLIFIVHNDGRIAAAHDGIWVFSSNAGITAGIPYHIIWQLTAGSIHFFVNGTPYGSGAFSYTDDFAYDLILGSFHSKTPTYDLAGDLDEFHIYSRALPQADILRHSQKTYP